MAHCVVSKFLPYSLYLRTSLFKTTIFDNIYWKHTDRQLHFNSPQSWPNLTNQDAKKQLDRVLFAQQCAKNFVVFSLYIKQNTQSNFGKNTNQLNTSTSIKQIQKAYNKVSTEMFAIPFNLILMHLHLNY